MTSLIDNLADCYLTTVKQGLTPSESFYASAPSL